MTDRTTSTLATAPAIDFNGGESRRQAPPVRDGLRAGRWMGAAMLFGFAAGIFSNFKLQDELFSAPGFLVQGAGQVWQIGSMLLLALTTGTISLAIAALLRHRYGAARPLLTAVYLALVAVGLALSLMEGASLLTMRSLSEAYLAALANAGDQQSVAMMFDPAREVVRGIRNGIHFPDKLLGGLCVLLMYLILYRQRALPRALAVAGMVAATLQMTAVARELFGLEVIYLLLAPLALAYVATGVWLLVRGLDAPPAAAVDARAGRSH